ncbi:microtubule-actin cross-linking factor 1, isoforms 6/7-like isoform X2 [Haliotis asinina]|uniref:microtubule-actin cross-linking factor 1, isoforms 6/7-like isoform X2 n=1 Tax=Haliotis asinina TaxID=109174 RepID=UPI00353255DD
MVLQKKKKSVTTKKKFSSSKTVDQADIKYMDREPSTLISDTTQTVPDATSKGQKRQGKKKKMTKAQRAQEKLEKSTEKIRNNPEMFNVFVNRMDRWLKQKSSCAVEMFKKIDTEGEGIITYSQFKSGMFDLNAPLNKVELHLLATLLDTADSDEIDYTELGNGLQHKRYLHIELRLVTFEKFKHHPGHVNVLVHSHLPVFGLVQLLVHLTSVQSTKISIFQDKTRTKDVRLPPDFRLEDCGYEGNSKDNPQEIMLYYDYTVEFTDCPILVCDHYF